MSTTPQSSRTAILVPELGTGEEPLRVSAWLVDVGQTVIAGDRVVEVLVRGITFDIAAERTGEVIEITRPVETVVNVGEILGWISTSEQD